MIFSKETMNKYSDEVAGLMITYPSTFGFFERELLNQ